MRILVAEDDDSVAGALVSVLGQRGYDTVRAATKVEALAACSNGRPVDLILLDLWLLDGDSAAIAPQLRAAAGAPLIIVTARGDIPSRVSGLRGGADDYVVKPFSIDELLARVESVLRRSRPREVDDRIHCGDVVISQRTRTVTVAGDPVELTRIEFDLLATIAAECGRVVDRQRLYLIVWGTDWHGTGRTLEAHIHSLRSKLGRPGLIVTVRGVGYRIAAPRDDADPRRAAEDHDGRR